MHVNYKVCSNSELRQKKTSDEMNLLKQICLHLKNIRKTFNILYIKALNTKNSEMFLSMYYIILGWFNCTNMIRYCICLFTFNIIHHKCPDFFNNIIRLKKTPYHTKYPNDVELSYNITMAYYRSNSIYLKMCNLWNNLPSDLILESLVPLFKNRLRNYFLAQQLQT